MVIERCVFDSSSDGEGHVTAEAFLRLFRYVTTFDLESSLLLLAAFRRLEASVSPVLRVNFFFFFAAVQFQPDSSSVAPIPPPVAALSTVSCLASM